MHGETFRFAPSPNGELHLGHAYSALLNHDLARAAGARLLLRHENIDLERCSPRLEASVEADLDWLGIRPHEAPRRQSEHFVTYREALEALRSEGLVYPAFMTRGEVRGFAALAEEREGRAWPRDPDGALLYPGLDRALDPAEARRRIEAGEPHAFRLDMQAALARVGALSFVETGAGEGEEGRAIEVAADPAAWGDVVLARRDVPTSYHLAVVVDDAI